VSGRVVQAIHRMATPMALCLLLGIVLRVLRYALDSPLWWNEAFLAVNLLKRGWLELLGALDYHQVCPPGFLWGEKAVVALLGFHEGTLRLIPLASGVGALVVMSLLGRSVLPARPAWLAVLLLAVAYHPIRLASEVKPYATDLAVSALVLGVAARGLRCAGASADLRSLVVLTVLAPLGLAVSYPAVFVLGGAAAVLLVDRWPTADRATRWWLAGLCSSVAVSFVGLLVVAVSAQARSADASQMAEYWAEGLPRWYDPAAFGAWLVRVHTGPLLCLPAGSGPAVGVPALILAALGGRALLRSRRVALLCLYLAPFALTLAAALLDRYPYGSRARVVQHLVPALCWLMALGTDLVVRWIARREDRRKRIVRVVAFGLVLVGVLPLIPDVRRPWRTPREEHARAFARTFWPSLGPEPTACLRWDVPVLPWESPNPDVALYLCNQAIYSPTRHLRQADDQAHRVALPPPRRFVAFDSPDVPEAGLGPWLAAMEASAGPARIEQIWLAGHEGRAGRVRVCTFDRMAHSEDPARNGLQSGERPPAPEVPHVDKVAANAR
jgi:hypothetical protein